MTCFESKRITCTIKFNDMSFLVVFWSKLKTWKTWKTWKTSLTGIGRLVIAGIYSVQVSLSRSFFQTGCISFLHEKRCAVVQEAFQGTWRASLSLVQMCILRRNVVCRVKHAALLFFSSSGDLQWVSPKPWKVVLRLLPMGTGAQNERCIELCIAEDSRFPRLASWQKTYIFWVKDEENGVYARAILSVPTIQCAPR